VLATLCASYFPSALLGACLPCNCNHGFLSAVERFPGPLRLQRDPEDDEGSQAVAIASDRVDLDHGLLMRRELSSRRHRSKRGATILSTMALGAQAVTAVASQVEHSDVGPDVRFLLLS
jgi:hypothetical protein